MNSSQTSSCEMPSPASSGKAVAGCSRREETELTHWSSHVATWRGRGGDKLCGQETAVELYCTLPDSVMTLALSTLPAISLIFSPSRPSSLSRASGRAWGRWLCHAHVCNRPVTSTAKRSEYSPLMCWNLSPTCRDMFHTQHHMNLTYEFFPGM